MSFHRFSQSDREAVYRAIAERRDMRHFAPDPVEPEVLARLLQAAHHAPSVGYMQPWRFIRITNIGLRRRIHEMVEAERVKTSQALGQREEEFMRLKVEGILDCGEVLIVSLKANREQHVFGRRTMPEMDLASTSCAIQNMWLAARAEGLGMGWVSLFDPERLAELLAMPPGSQPIAVLCLGHVQDFYPKPMLALEDWADLENLSDLVFDDSWGQPSALDVTAAVSSTPEDAGEGKDSDRQVATPALAAQKG